MSFIIGIDAGHGGSNTGAQANGIVEKLYTQAMAEVLKSRLFLHWGVEPFLVRQNYLGSYDIDMSLYRRGEKTKALQCDLVLCLHVNAHTSPDLKGFQIYYTPGNRHKNKIAQAITRCVPPSLAGSKMIWEAENKPDTEKDNWLQRPINVLKPHAHTMALLIELGYCTNDRDSRALKQDRIKDQLCLALMMGAIKAKGLHKG